MSRKEEIEARKLELRDEIEAAEDTAKVEELYFNLAVLPVFLLGRIIFIQRNNSK